MTDHRLDHAFDPEDSVRLRLKELGRGKSCETRDLEDSAVLLPEPHNERCEESKRELRRNAFPAD